MIVDQIEVERPWSPANGAPPPGATLERMQAAHQRFRGKVGLDARDGIHKRRDKPLDTRGQFPFPDTLCQFQRGTFCDARIRIVERSNENRKHCRRTVPGSAHSRNGRAPHLRVGIL